MLASCSNTTTHNNPNIQNDTIPTNNKEQNLITEITPRTEVHIENPNEIT